MAKREYQRALARAKRDMIELLKQRQRIDGRISQLKATITNLEGLQKDFAKGEPPLSSVELGPALGLTKSIRQILQGAAPLAVSANEIRQAMVTGGFDFSGYSNPLASIHTVLNRLVEQRLVHAEKAPGNLKTYRWYTDTEIALGLLGDSNDSERKKGLW